MTAEARLAARSERSRSPSHGSRDLGPVFTLASMEHAVTDSLARRIGFRREASASRPKRQSDDEAGTSIWQIAGDDRAAVCLGDFTRHVQA